jgi:hypothetical protein
VRPLVLGLWVPLFEFAVFERPVFLAPCALYCEAFPNSHFALMNNDCECFPKAVTITRETSAVVA